MANTNDEVLITKKKPNRKPMDKLNGYDSREAMWAEIRRCGREGFTVRKLRDSTTLQVETVREYVTGLVNAGYLAKAPHPGPLPEGEGGCDSRHQGVAPTGEEGFCKKTAVYTLVRDVGIDAPRVRKDGTPVTQGQGTANMWRTMRILGTFSARELAVSASTETCVIKEDTARSYLGHLCEAGYLRKVKGMFRFVGPMYTGPKPPMIQRVKRVWDQNLKKVMWSEEAITNCELRIKNEGGGL